MTAAPFKIETLQQAMRAAWVGAYRGLASQGWRQAVDGDDNCVWRGIAPDGRTTLRCAVGWLIPDAALRHAKRVSGDVTNPLLRTAIAEPLRSWVMVPEFAEFLDALQWAHDGAGCADDMRARMEMLREQHRLGPVPSLAVAS